MAKRVNYLNNKDLLAEIHKSKLSFCWFQDEENTVYDIIIGKDDKITRSVLKEARQNRATRQEKRMYEEAMLDWETNNGKRSQRPKQNQFNVDPKSIKDEELVIRVMTFDHIPLEQRKNKPKTVADHHSRCNYPPFKHVRLKEGEWEEVLRSHWEGGIGNGHFSVDHGTITPKLAKMFMMLCHRYSMRSNWRGYTYVDEMRSQALLQLSQIGLQFDESKSQNPFAYYTAAITNSFTRVLNLEKRNQNIRDDLLIEAGQNPSWTRQIEHEMKMKELDEHTTVPSTNR
tara:strand:- start:2528 stop:3385 length:858 start_codon:yes stop_codon:yes gene_type:complete